MVEQLDSSVRISALLHEAAARHAADVHLVPGYPVTFRIHGSLVQADASTSPQPGSAGKKGARPQGAGHAQPLTAEEVRDMIRSVLPPALFAQIQTRKNVDASIEIEHEGKPCRFRGNVFYTHGEMGVCLRHVPNEIPTFEWMGFPEALANKLVHYPNGLVIVTGVTGSGKTTTLAAMIDLLNRQGGTRIITIEEPIEYIHPKLSSTVITQREIGRDVDSFYDGLKYGLRQDPDVILIGEIRDSETAAMALSAAETGHLILTTLHTRDAKGAITRFVDLFPHDAHDDVRVQLSLSLRAVVSQHLLPAAEEGGKRALAMEVMHANNPVRIGIRFGKIDSIESAIQTGKRDGMLSLDDHLEHLVRTQRITPQTALRYAKDPDALSARVGGK